MMRNDVDIIHRLGQTVTRGPLLSHLVFVLRFISSGALAEFDWQLSCEVVGQSDVFVRPVDVPGKSKMSGLGPFLCCLIKTVKTARCPFQWPLNGCITRLSFFPSCHPFLFPFFSFFSFFSLSFTLYSFLFHSLRAIAFLLVVVVE